MVTPDLEMPFEEDRSRIVGHARPRVLKRR
jgi:hypothetical protein